MAVKVPAGTVSLMAWLFSFLLTNPVYGVVVMATFTALNTAFTNWGWTLDYDDDFNSYLYLVSLGFGIIGYTQAAWGNNAPSHITLKVNTNIWLITGGFFIAQLLNCVLYTWLQSQAWVTAWRIVLFWGIAIVLVGVACWMLRDAVKRYILKNGAEFEEGIPSPVVYTKVEDVSRTWEYSIAVQVTVIIFGQFFVLLQSTSPNQDLWTQLFVGVISAAIDVIVVVMFRRKKGGKVNSKKVVDEEEENENE